jgi:drug/metabolite transporter (DMT)-like permease
VSDAAARALPVRPAAPAAICRPDRRAHLLNCRAIVPIGACYAATLWVGNVAYLYLSVSFIQMLKASMPVAVFFVGCLFGTEKFSWGTQFNMLLVGFGIAIAAYGEINFVPFGVMCQMASIVTESVRLVLVQLLLQSRGLKLNPITTLYYVAPCCAAFLSVPFFAVEASKMAADPNLVISPLLLLSNAAAAFGLNMAVFLLIGKTSALTMNIGGVVKDWMLIGLSYVLYKAPVTQINLIGYFIAFLAVCWYNYRKLQAMKNTAAAALSSSTGARDSEGARLLGGEGSPTKSPVRSA